MFKNIGNSWEFVGDVTPIENYKTSLQTIKIVNNEVYIAYKSVYNNSGNIYTKKLDATSLKWINIGSIAINDYFTQYLSMAISKTGTPHIFINAGVYKNGSSYPIDKTWLKTGDVLYNSIVIDNNDVPVVTYSDSENNGRAVVKELYGLNWKVVGTPGFSQGVAQETSIAINKNNTPYVVYVDYYNGKKASVQKFNGKNWEVVGITGFSKGEVDKTSIIIDKNDVPYVCYIDIANDNKITVQKFDGVSWKNVGIEGFSAGIVLYPAIAIDNYNLPYVIYRDEAYSGKATVQKFNGSNWTILGTPGFSNSKVTNTSISFTFQNVLYISYTDVGGFSKLIVQRYNSSDTSWKAIGNTIYCDSNKSNGSMVIDKYNNIYVVYKNGSSLNVSKLENIENETSKWTSEEVHSGWGNEYGKIAMNSEGLLYIVYLYGGKVTVKKPVENNWGESWETLGNIEVSEGKASEPSIAIGSDSMPIVAYSSPGLFAKYFGEENALSTSSYQSENYKTTIYPNPVLDILKIESNFSINEILIFDLFGKKVLNNSNLSEIDVRSLANGIYLVKIVTPNSIQNFKIIKE